MKICAIKNFFHFDVIFGKKSRNEEIKITITIPFRILLFKKIVKNLRNFVFIGASQNRSRFILTDFFLHKDQNCNFISNFTTLKLKGKIRENCTLKKIVTLCFTIFHFVGIRRNFQNPISTRILHS